MPEKVYVPDVAKAKLFRSDSIGLRCIRRARRSTEIESVAECWKLAGGPRPRRYASWKD